ncbi:TolC family protein [Peptococcaceae bacterium]|nr:TolC family protein [Peptococcaceae bacterium]
MKRALCMFLSFLVFFSIISFKLGECSAEAEEEMLFITLDDAIERALEHNFDIKLADLNVDRAREVMKYAWEAHNRQLIKTYQPVLQLYVSVPPDKDAFPLMMKSNRNWHIQKRLFEIKKDALVLKVKRNYYDILTKQQELLAMESALEEAEYRYNAVKARRDAGMATDVQLMSAKSALEKAKAEVEQKRAELENSKKRFCEIIGLPIEANVVLVDHLSLQEIEIPSLRTAVTFATSPEHNPYLWILRERYELQRYIWTYTQPDEAGKIDREKLYLEYKKERLNIEEKMRSTYNNLMALEEAYKSAKETLLTAKRAVEVAEIMRENGMATEGEVLKRKVEMQKALAALLKTASAYELAKEKFLKPWLLAEMEQKSEADQKVPAKTRRK